MAKRSVVALIEYQGKILLGKKPPNSESLLAGEWTIPGEKLNDRESDEQGLYRLVEEETGLKRQHVKILNYLGKSLSPTSKHPVRWYRLQSFNDHVSANDDLIEVKWVPKNLVRTVIGRRYSDYPDSVRDYMRS